MKGNVSTKAEINYEKERMRDKIRNLLVNNKLDLVESLLEKFSKKFNCNNYDLLLFLDFYVKKRDPINAIMTYTYIDENINFDKVLFSDFFKLCYQTGYYKIAYSLLSLLPKKSYFDENQIKRIELTLDKKLGHEIKYDISSLYYCEMQIVSYSMNRAIKHIKKHIYCDKEKEFIFYYNTDFEKLYNLVQLNIPNAVMGNSSNVTDVYIFEYLGIGYKDKEVIDYLKVVTVRDTCDIITMHPCNNSKDDYVNELDFSLEKSKEKIKNFKL